MKKYKSSKNRETLNMKTLKSKKYNYKIKILNMLIAPSILSANYSKLGQQIKSVENANYLHIDVMDGHYVDNITIGPVVIKDINTSLKKDVHLMIENPEKYINAFAKAGADIITFHVETVKDSKSVINIINKIRKLGINVGIAINVDTSPSKIFPYLTYVDQVIVMAVRAGFGGQNIIPKCLVKVKQIREKFSGDIEVDGGINNKTIKTAQKMGTNIFVSGSFIFNSKNPTKQVEILKKFL